MPPPADRASLFADPRWIPTHLDRDRGAVEFLWLPRETQARIAFLTHQDAQAKAPHSAWLPLAELEPAPAVNGPHFIFHSAFCRSTLLARALDSPGASMGLKEPQILNELATVARQGQLGEPTLNAFLALLGRPFGPGERVVVKPSNVVNVLAEAILRARPDTKVLLLYAPLPAFLGSVTRKGMWGRIWGRRLLALLRKDGGLDVGMAGADLLELTDIQAAALAWLHHHVQFQQLVQRHPGIRILSANDLVARRTESLRQVSSHFDLGIDQERAAQIASSAVFREHSKEIGREFDGDSAAGTPEPLIAEEIAMVHQWAEAVAKNAGVTLDFPRRAELLPG